MTDLRLITQFLINQEFNHFLQHVVFLLQHHPFLSETLGMTSEGLEEMLKVDGGMSDWVKPSLFS
jgi:hypothetical protein